MSVTVYEISLQIAAFHFGVKDVDRLTEDEKANLILEMREEAKKGKIKLAYYPMEQNEDIVTE